MKINWQVRFKNPIFWVNIIIVFMTPILTALGLNWTDLTTWGAVLDVLKQAIFNPQILIYALVGVWVAINDPTTEGLSDSIQALGYTRPKGDS